MAEPLSRRWVIIAGTGIPEELTFSEKYAAQAIGKALADYEYGLVTGGWHGIDEIATKAFVDKLHTKSLDPAEYLIQVIPEDTEDSKIPIRQGHIVRVPHGSREWLDLQSFADAIVLIGGRGGAYVAWLAALRDGLPRFPLGSTTGDAAKAFNDTFTYWELMPILGIDKTDFEILRNPINSEANADEVAKKLVKELLPRSLTAVDNVKRRDTKAAKSMFISYSHKDTDWVNRLRNLLHKAERYGLLSTWIDSDIEAGDFWEGQIFNHVAEANFALLLMSNNLCQSKYVIEKEIPALIKRKTDEPTFRLFWALIEPCNWQSIPGLADVQAIGSVKTAISECCTEADKQCRLIKVVDKILETISRSGAENSDESHS
jgi:TIR domain